MRSGREEDVTLLRKAVALLKPYNYALPDGNPSAERRYSDIKWAMAEAGLLRSGNRLYRLLTMEHFYASMDSTHKINETLLDIARSIIEVD